MVFRVFCVLSDNANPPEHRKRLLDDDDLAVFALVAEMRARGLVFDDIKGATTRGSRFNPANPGAVVPADKSRLAKLQSDVNRLSEALQVTMDENKELKAKTKR